MVQPFTKRPVSFTAKYVHLNTTSSTLTTPLVTRSTNLHDMQIYGVIITALLIVAVFMGAKMIARLGPSFLIPVMVSVIFIFIGIVTAPRGQMQRKLLYLVPSSSKNFGLNWNPASYSALWSRPFSSLIGSS